ncbi:MAG: hypothetical protein NTY46_02705 [Candidatus Sumerlaeota bacterium]|nr:hypothetical protein [Candidatus Sumerlaeota bacterium]
MRSTNVNTRHKSLNGRTFHDTEKSGKDAAVVFCGVLLQLG